MDNNYTDPRRVERSTFGEVDYATAEAQNRAVASQRATDAPEMERPPLQSLGEMISACRVRVLHASDALANHSDRIHGRAEMSPGSGDLGIAVSAANNVGDVPLLDRLFIEIKTLQDALRYLENQTDRATRLA